MKTIELKSCDIPVAEQETTISFSRDEERAEVYTSDNRIVTKMQKLLNTPETSWKLDKTLRDLEGIVIGYIFSCPKDRILFSAKKREGREFTEEQKQAAAERLKALRAKGRGTTEEL